MNPQLHVITGPTASGKTDLCLCLAEELDAEILSCDSMQMYIGMDIGTAKPSKDQLSTVPHHGIDLFPVSHAASIHDYIRIAGMLVDDILGRNKNVLVTGGSGFYLKSFFVPVCDNVVVPVEVREEIDNMLEEDGLDVLVGRLLELNPGGVGNLDLQNPRRVARALERCLVSGKTVKRLRQEMESLPEPFAGMGKKVCVLDRDDGNLKERIRARTQMMLETGLMEETRTLLDCGLANNPVANTAIGYREMIAFLGGELASCEEVEEAINRNTWQLVRRQRKWFRSQFPGTLTVNLDLNPQPAVNDLFG